MLFRSLLEAPLHEDKPPPRPYQVAQTQITEHIKEHVGEEELAYDRGLSCTRRLSIYTGDNLSGTCIELSDVAE